MNNVKPSDLAIAKALYVSGESFEVIAEAIDYPNIKDIKLWAKDNGWDDDRTKYLTKVEGDVLGRLFEKRQKEIENLEVIMDTSFDPIKDKTLSPTNFLDASRMYLAAYRAKRETNELSISQSLILNTAQAVSKWINDENLRTMSAQELKRQIGLELAKLFDKLLKESRESNERAQGSD